MLFLNSNPEQQPTEGQLICWNLGGLVGCDLLHERARSPMLPELRLMIQILNDLLYTNIYIYIHRHNIYFYVCTIRYMYIHTQCFLFWYMRSCRSYIINSSSLDCQHVGVFAVCP